MYIRYKTANSDETREIGSSTSVMANGQWVPTKY